MGLTRWPTQPFEIASAYYNLHWELRKIFIDAKGDATCRDCVDPLFWSPKRALMMFKNSETFPRRPTDIPDHELT